MQGTFRHCPRHNICRALRYSHQGQLEQLDIERAAIAMQRRPRDRPAHLLRLLRRAVVIHPGNSWDDCSTLWLQKKAVGWALLPVHLRLIVHSKRLRQTSRNVYSTNDLPDVINTQETGKSAHPTLSVCNARVYPPATGAPSEMRGSNRPEI